MRKILLPLALTGLMLSGISFSADALTATNLCPNFEFNKAETPLQFVGSTPATWNLPVGWVHDHILNGDIDATGGAVVLSGGAPIVNNPTFYQTLNQNMRLLKLGGTCGNVWAINYNNSGVENKLNAYEGVQVEIPSTALAAGWFEQYHYIFIPDPAVMLQNAGKTLRCRMELNIYKASGLEDNAFYGYLQTDQNDSDNAVASDHRVKFSEFYTDGEWDATKWMVYEFEFKVPGAAEDLASWTSAPRFKFETEKASGSCIMIRNITVYDPEAATDVEPVDLTTHKFVTYSVGPEIVEPDPIEPDPIEPGLTMAEDISDNTFISTGFLFNKATTAPKFAAKNSTSEWNLPTGWIKTNIIDGDVANEGGSLILSGDGSIKDYDCLATFNEHVHHVNLGGTCENVLAINFKGTSISSHLNSNYNIEFPENGFESVWSSSSFNLFAVPDYTDMAQYADKTVRVRMEVNLYGNDATSNLAFKAWGTNDQGAISEDDVTYAGEHTVKAADFVDADGKWDPTLWRAYEFDMYVEKCEGDVKDWTYAPNIKLDVAGCANGTLLIRNIYIWDPAAQSRAYTGIRETEKWSRYTVGPVEPEPVEPGLTMAEDISDNTFISTGLLFNEATTAPKFAAKNSTSEWNLPTGWIKTNIIDGDVANEGGSLILSGDGSIKDYDCLATFNEHVHHVDLGGTCKNVLAINFKGTSISDHLNSNHNITFPANGFESVWSSTSFNLFAVPDYAEMAQYADKTVRVRMELNLYENDGAETMAFKAWGTNDQGAINEADVTYAGEHTVKAADFVDADGKWDPTLWRAYEFEMYVEKCEGDVKDWTCAPNIKLDVAGCTNGTLLIRNIYIWDPAAQSRAYTGVRETEKWSRYTVSPVSALDFIDSTKALYSINGNMVTFSQNADVYDVAGRKVADCTAGEATQLSAGFYVARTEDGAKAKFVVR